MSASWFRRAHPLVIGCAVMFAGCTAKEPAEPKSSAAVTSAPAAQSSAPTAPAYVPPSGATSIGQPLTQAAVVKLAALQSDAGAHLSKTVLVEATAEAVCQAKGCWMTVKDGSGPPIWVRWGSGCGGAFAFPKDAAGKRVLVEGTLVESEITSEQAAHYASESPGMDPAKIVGKTFEISATACVMLPGSETQSPS
jgi:hypothetical protein